MDPRFGQCAEGHVLPPHLEIIKIRAQFITAAAPHVKVLASTAKKSVEELKIALDTLLDQAFDLLKNENCSNKDIPNFLACAVGHSFSKEDFAYGDLAENAFEVAKERLTVFVLCAFNEKLIERVRGLEKKKTTLRDVITEYFKGQGKDTSNLNAGLLEIISAQLLDEEMNEASKTHMIFRLNFLRNNRATSLAELMKLKNKEELESVILVGGWGLGPQSGDTKKLIQEIRALDCLIAYITQRK